MIDDQYRLIDFGDGRKLESLCGHLVDRPSPAAVGAKRLVPQQWEEADSRFDSHTKRWDHRRVWPADLAVNCGGFRISVQPTPFGHIGLFPEQQSNWRWLAQGSKSHESSGHDKNALNLFAYTGASTLALASAGYRVAHVDAAKPNVQAARESARLNGWSERPIRYLIDDAAKFVGREVRRQNRYDTIVLDPPAYGHSPKGKAWRIERDIWPLLENCLALVDARDFRMLVTGHSPRFLHRTSSVFYVTD